MNVTASALRELHRIHQQLTDLRERLDRGPKQVRARQANVASAEEALATIHAEIKAARLAADQKQLEVKSSEARIADRKVKMNMCTSNREYQALKEQIAADEMANSVLQDEALEALERVDQLREKVGPAEGVVKKGKEELAKVQQAVSEQEVLLRADITRLEADLREAEKVLPGELRDHYHRLVKARGEEAMAPVENDTCSGCYNQITPNMANDLALSRAVFCKSCGRLLYLPEDRSVGRV